MKGGGDEVVGDGKYLESYQNCCNYGEEGEDSVSLLSVMTDDRETPQDSASKDETTIVSMIS